MINSLYYPNIYLANQTLPGITTTVLDYNPLLFGKLSKNGWDYGQPCLALLEATGDAPEIDIT